ncbi:hypothetical protein D3C80_1479090 [compost metagenome]
MRERAQQRVGQQLQVLRIVFAEQGEHAVVAHDRWRLAQQVRFQGFPVQAQGFEEQRIAVTRREAHGADRLVDLKPEVLDKAGGADKGIQQRRGGQLALDLVIEAGAGHGITRQGGSQALGSGVIF